MKSTEVKQPILLSTPIAEKADEELINEIQQQVALEPHNPTIQYGFPLLTMIPKIQGGEPPAGQDINGLFKVVSSHNFYQSTGGNYTFNQELSDAIGGYPKGAELKILSSEGERVTVYSLIDDNTYNFVEHPEYIDGIHWKPSNQKTNFTSQVVMIAGNEVPEATKLCDGAPYKIVEYPILYSMIGTQYGNGADSYNYRGYDYRDEVYYTIDDLSLEKPELDLYDEANQLSVVGTAYNSLTTPTCCIGGILDIYYSMQDTETLFPYYSYLISNMNPETPLNLQFQVNATLIGDVTLNNGVLNHFSFDDYAIAEINKTFYSIDTFKYVTKFKLSEDDTYMVHPLIGSMGIYANGASFGIKINENNNFVISLSSDGNEWDIANEVAGTHQIVLNIDYYLRLTYDGESYKLSFSFDGIDYIDDIVIQSPTTMYNELSSYTLGANEDGFIHGQIDLKTTYLEVNGNREYDGVKYVVYCQTEMQEITGIRYNIYDYNFENVVGRCQFKDTDTQRGFYFTLTDDTVEHKAERDSSQDVIYKRWLANDNYYYTNETLTVAGVNLFNETKRNAIIGVAFSEQDYNFGKKTEDNFYIKLERNAEKDTTYDGRLFNVPNLKIDGLPIKFYIYY